MIAYHCLRASQHRCCKANRSPTIASGPPGAITILPHLCITPAKPMQKLRHHHILDRAARFLTCWGQQAPDTTFAGLKLSDLENEYAKAKNARDQVHAAEAALRARRHALKQTDRQLATLLKRFASGVRGHGAFGTNCPFYRALGFVTDDRNRGGRPRGAGKKQ